MNFLNPSCTLPALALLLPICLIPTESAPSLERPVLSADFLDNAVGCDDTRKRAIERVLEDASSVFELMEEHSANRTARHNSAEYYLAFGHHASVRAVKSCINKIANTISIEVGSCRGRGTQGTASYWNPGGRYYGFSSSIWSNPQKPNTSSIPTSALGTVIHEMSHALCGTTDELYNDTNFYVGWHSIEIYNRARNEPRDLNDLPHLADAYRIYAEQLWYRYLRLRELSVDAALHPIPAQKPEGRPYCGDFEQADWPAAGRTSAVPRGFAPSSYKSKPAVPGALFAGPYQWGGARCGGQCSIVVGVPVCKMVYGGRSPVLQ